MARVRSRRPIKHKASIAVLHMVTRRFAQDTHYYAQWRAGAERAGIAYGFSLDDFWVEEDLIGPAQFERMLRGRNISGVLLLCCMSVRSLPPAFSALLQHYSVAAAGFPRADLPRVPVATNDRFATGAMLYRQAERAGYRSIGVVLHPDTEPIEDARFSAGVEFARSQHLAGTVVPTLRCRPECPEDFRAWLRQQAPDCIITSMREVWNWLKEMELAVPEQLGFLNWQVRSGDENWSGADQNDSEVGVAAMELVVGQLRNGRRGEASVRRRILVESSFVQGRTMRESVEI